MNPVDLDLVRKAKGFPSVSILFATHAASGGREDHIRLRNLLTEAGERLAAEGRKSDGRKVLEKLERLALEVRPGAAYRGLALFANRDVAVKMDLPFPVPERVVVDETFATRDLVSILNRTPRYWVLVLAEKGTRLLRGTGESLREVEAHGFPMSMERPEETKRHAKAPQADKKDEAALHFFQRVDKAYAEAAKAEPHPLVLVGVERHLSHFASLGVHREVLATVEGSHARTGAAQIGKLVAPHVQEGLRKRTKAALRDLEKAVGARKYVSGTGEAWRLAREGRVAALLVEEEYRQPARLDPTGSRLELVNDPADPGVIDDVVDEVIETALEKGGRVVFVAKGALAAHQRIAAILRY